MKNWDPIELLRHTRHNWLNKLQVIQAYLTIGNEKRVKELIDEIIFECEQEAKLSNLPFRQLSTFFLTYPFENNPVLLKYEVDSDGTANGTMDEKISMWFQQLMKNINEAVFIGEENEMYIKIEVKNQSIRFFIHFTGLIEDGNPVENFIKQADATLVVENFQFSKETFQFSIRL
ncbi:Spo0B C-terminal domain-containing protein [Fervidibacillus albus]|uniref:Sporulation initiation phosphotransferase B n=1 Tax=Fervidibacillus albus TaxID=2980026 RepID=A0A9E8LV47_9BACI|nr:Spo0B C-terminal domain-containing protein [Fervidibacillus albus]WAA10253.1 sporulation initiation phosphotransferase B [Fervidibacillus albus]